MTQEETNNKIYLMFILADQIDRVSYELKLNVSGEIRYNIKNIYNKAHKLVSLADNSFNDREQSDVFGENSDELYALIVEWLNKKLEE